MYFAFNDEQNLLKESVERFVGNEYSFEKRSVWAASDLGYSQENWKQLAELGWLGLGVPEELGGYGGTPVETAIIMEGVGQGLMVEPVLPTSVLGGTLLVHGGGEQHRSLIGQLVAGDLQLAFAYAEPQSRFNLFDVTTLAKRDGESFILDGHKSVVFNASSADRIFVTARIAGNRGDRDGLGVFMIDPSSEGVTLKSYPTVDGLRAADVELSAVRVDASDVLGPIGEAADLIERTAHAGIVAACAEAVGVMKVMQESTLEYLRMREQFDTPLAKFQALQHRMVDMYVGYELSRSMAYMAAVKLEGVTAAERQRNCAAAKVQIGNAGRLVGQDSIQLHGGMGMTNEMAISHYFKRLTMLDLLFGTADYHLEQIAEMPA